MQKKLLEIYDILLKTYGHQDWWPGETFDEIVIGAILTQNTSWSNVEKAIKNLKESEMCSLEKIVKVGSWELGVGSSKKLPTPISSLPTLIKPSGYYNIKAQRLINVANKILTPNFYTSNEGIKLLREKLLSINGVGPETADSIILYAYNLPIFVIDAYTKRLFSRIGIMDEKKSYMEFQRLFMENLEHDTQLFNEYHALIVVHCKNVCKVKPLCDECCLKDKNSS